MNEFLDLEIRRGLDRDSLVITEDEINAFGGVLGRAILIHLANKPKREWYCEERCVLSVRPGLYECDKREVFSEELVFYCSPVVEFSDLAYLIGDFWGYKVYFYNPQWLTIPLNILQSEEVLKKVLKKANRLFFKRRRYYSHRVATDYQVYCLMEYGIPISRIIRFCLENEPECSDAYKSTRRTFHSGKVYGKAIRFIRRSTRKSFTPVEAAWFLYQIAKEGKEKMKEFFSRIVDGWEIFKEGDTVGVKWPEAPAGFENWKFPASFLAIGLPITKYEGRGKKIIPLHGLVDEGARLIEANSHIKTLHECEDVVHRFKNKTIELVTRGVQESKPSEQENET